MTLQESTSPTADGILVSIKNNGLSFLDEKEASLEEIEMHLRDATTIQTKPGIVLLVEDEAKQDQVLQILKLCQELDLSNVTFRDQNEDKLIE